MAEGRLSTKTEQEEETEGGCVWWVVWPGLAEGKEGISPSLHSGREGDEKKTQQLQQLQGYGLLDRPAE